MRRSQESADGFGDRGRDLKPMNVGCFQKREKAWILLKAFSKEYSQSLDFTSETQVRFLTL